MTEEAVSSVHAEPSILTRLGLALIDVGKAGFPFKGKAQIGILGAHMHHRSKESE